MSDHYQIFGAELSPYSVKVRAFFRYKGIPHDWLPRTDDNMAEFQKFAKLPLVPLVVSNHGDAWQDSTPIIEEFETMFPEPSIIPDDPALAFISALIEEYADEWANKYMFHYRWWYDADQLSAAQRLARGARPHAADIEIEAMAQMLRERMVQRLGFVGSHSSTKEQIEYSFARTLKLLEKHLTHRSFLFGERPALADFGLAAQLYQCWTDPTPRKLFDQKAPNVAAWAEQMQDPSAQGAFEDWDSLETTLLPFLQTEIGGLFLPWSDANAIAIEQGQEKLSVKLEGKSFTQTAQKYHARSLAILRERYAGIADNALLGDILDKTGCLAFLHR